MPKTIETVEQLEALYNQPAATSLNKVTDYLTPEYQQLVEASPFCLVASHGPEGLDCSPRGDLKSCVKVLNEKTVAIPDWRGNNRLDTLRNIVRTGNIALCMLIPGLEETLRINGAAKLSTDPDLLQQLAHSPQDQTPKLPITVIIIDIHQVYFQCARALKRSDLWNSERHVQRSELPTAGQMIRSAQKDFDAKAYDKALPERHSKTLY